MPEIKNVAFLGSFTLGLQCFEYLLNCRDVNVRALITSKTSSSNPTYEKFVDLAEKRSVAILTKEDELLNHDIDLGFSVHHLNIIKKPVIDHFPMGIVNLHPGPLPEYRGSFPFIHAICNGENFYGSAIHFINSKVDDGPLIKVSRCTIERADTAWKLSKKIEQSLYNDFVSTLPLIISGKITSIPQESIIKKPGPRPKTYIGAMLEEKRRVDLSWPEEKIRNHVRAFQFPGIEPAYALIEGKKIYLQNNNDS